MSTKVFDMRLLDERKTGYVVNPPPVWINDFNVSTDGGTKERSKSMLVRVAMIERVRDDKGNPLTPVVIVPAEDVPMVTMEGIRERMLVKYAEKLEGKDLSRIEVVCSDFVSRRG